MGYRVQPGAENSNCYPRPSHGHRHVPRGRIFESVQPAPSSPAGSVQTNHGSYQKSNDWYARRANFDDVPQQAGVPLVQGPDFAQSGAQTWPGHRGFVTDPAPQ